MEENQFFQERSDLSDFKAAVSKIREGINEIIVGNHETAELMVVVLLAGGHILLEGVPGIAKTLLAKLLAKSLDMPFSRIQFTPDLMPSDILGTTIYNIQKSEFQFKKGPIFSGIILIDEINRSPAKTQASLFEVMEEKQITLDGITYPMHQPFMVLATQNPIEQEGTYRLPEAQLDRFMMKVEMGYPSLSEEIEILKRENDNKLKGDHLNQFKPVLSVSDILHFQHKMKAIRIENPILDYIAKIITGTRTHKSLYLGASPRASLALLNCTKALAAIQGRDFGTPDDVRYLAPFVLKHRVMVSPEREMEGIDAEKVIQEIIQRTEVPR